MPTPKKILPTIVLSQFACTSLWFAGNAILPDLSANFQLAANVLGYLTSAVQLGFITGTLIFALLSIADRYAPSKIFFACAILGALFNLGTIWQGNTLASLLCFRFSTGFFLAGIYPVGMKIAADHYEKGLGKSLGFLVGALVVGTAFPHLLKEIKGALPWEFVVWMTSALAVLGGSLMALLVPNGPYRRASQQLQLLAIRDIFRVPKFRAAAFGYFGHMWELYTFWAFVPVMLQLYASLYPQVDFNIPLLSFLIIGIGGLACIIAGYWAQNIPAQRLAFGALFLSGGCCLMAPLFFALEAPILFVIFLLFWGMVVIADSPLFSTLVAQNAPSELKGTALTIVNCIGFFITILSIQLMNQLSLWTDSTLILIVLALGPIVGLLALSNNKPEIKN